MASINVLFFSAIVGPISGGFLLESFGYRRASFVLLVPEVFLVGHQVISRVNNRILICLYFKVFLLLLYLMIRKVMHSFDVEKQPLLKNP